MVVTEVTRLEEDKLFIKMIGQCQARQMDKVGAACGRCPRLESGGGGKFSVLDKTIHANLTERLFLKRTQDLLAVVTTMLLLKSDTSEKRPNSNLTESDFIE